MQAQPDLPRRFTQNQRSAWGQRSSLLHFSGIMRTIRACLLLICMSSSGILAHAEHAFEDTVHADALNRDALGRYVVTDARRLQPPSRADHHPQFSHGIRRVDADEAAMRTVVPYIAHDATVLGPATGASQRPLQNDLQRREAAGYSSHLTQSSNRKLLQDSSLIRRYPPCPRCRVDRCNGRSCRGRCRRRGQLRSCVARNGAPEPCDEVSEEEFVAQNKPPSSIPAGGSVVLTAAEPFIGCMVSADRPTGCPLPGTPATDEFGLRDTITIVNSTCLTPPFVPDCNGPFLPFGVCLCEIEITRPGQDPLVRPRACLTTVWPAWSGEVDPENEIVVEARGNTTHTGFSESAMTDPGQQPMFSYTVDVGEHFSGPSFPGFSGATVTQEIFSG